MGNGHTPNGQFPRTYCPSIVLSSYSVGRLEINQEVFGLKIFPSSWLVRSQRRKKERLAADKALERAHLDYLDGCGHRMWIRNQYDDVDDADDDEDADDYDDEEHIW